MHTFKNGLMYGSSWIRGRFMDNYRFGTISNIIQEPQEIQFVHVGSSESNILL